MTIGPMLLLEPPPFIVMSLPPRAAGVPVGVIADVIEDDASPMGIVMVGAMFASRFDLLRG